MYIPRSFAEPDLTTLQDFIDAHPLGILVTGGSRGLEATHLPLLLDRAAGPQGTLYGHLARANPQSRADAPETTDLMVVFSGPEAHITPEWYATKREGGRVVPTWNYVAVHVYGTLRYHDGPEFLREHLEALTTRHEGDRHSAWRMDDAPADYLEQQLKAIVGVSIAITRIEGKWKMSQNRSDTDIQGVVDGLQASGTPRDAAVAALVASRRPSREGAGGT